MALAKTITADNGITLSYHRIVGVSCTANQQNTIEVRSYLSAEAREKEKDAPAGDPANVYFFTQYLTCDYSQSAVIDDAYAYLKTLDDFKEASDC